MTVKRKIQIITAVSFIIYGLLGVLFLKSYQDLEHLSREQTLFQGIIDKSFAVRTLSFEALLFRENQKLLQGARKTEELSLALEAFRRGDEEVQKEVAHLRQELATMRDLLRELGKTPGSLDGGGETEKGRLIVTQALVKAQEIEEDTVLLMQKGTEAMVQERHTTLVAALISLAVMAALSMATLLLVAMSVLRPLKRLGSCIKAVQQGDLTVRADIRQGGEIGFLSAAFDGMVGEIEQLFTARRRTEEALNRKSGELEAFFTSALDLLCIADLDGHFRRLNAEWEKTLGYRLAELEGKRFLDFVHPDDLADTVAAVSNLKEGAEILNFTNRYRCRDGSYRWIEWRSFPVGDFIYAAARDITERKREEEEREKLQEQLQQSQKMEAIGRLAGGVAHDFNNMLGVILGHTNIALERMDPAHPLNTHLREILKAAERSADLTRQLLAFARKQIAAPRRLNLNDTVEGMFGMLKRLIGENIDLLWRPGSTLWPVSVDPSQLNQILVNLCVNARDAIDGAGKVTIETGNITLDETYSADHADVVPGDYVLLAVSDNGRGMDRETLGKLFEPFFTTKEIGKGTGLGLATVYGIVKQNQGFINVYSEPSQGTIFKICLPRFAGGEEPDRTETPPESADLRGRETILLVEDEPDLLSLAALLLEQLGYRVLSAGTPREALLLAEGHLGGIQLLITDVVMPEMNGQELGEKLLALHPDMKILFMSGYTANVIAHHGILDWGVNFIHKPFSKKDLAATVRRVLESRPTSPES